jgi:hydroxypyruvate reductase
MIPFPIPPHSLRSPAGEAIASVLQAALRAVDPAEAVRSHLCREGNYLTVEGRRYDLRRYRRVVVVAVGKAACPMAAAAAELLGERMSAGIVVTKDGHVRQQDRANTRLVLFESGHPIPDERGVEAAAAVFELLDGLTADDLLLALISGGGSALLTSPIPPLTLADLKTLTGQLLSCGATIDEINCLRKHLDAVKGGGLARRAAPATVLALLLSDVIGDALDVIASGPTVPDPTSYADAWGILEKYALVEGVPPAVKTILQAGLHGERPETPKPGDAIFEKVQNCIVASNRQALDAAALQARSLGWEVQILSDHLTGEARDAGAWLVEEAHRGVAKRIPGAPPRCYLAGGETTVTLRGKGLGGRNQEMALGMVAGLAGLKGVLAVTLATDGGDGPTDAAGAVVTGATVARAAALGLDAGAYLQNNDAYHFFEALGDLLITGPTQTNVNDLALVWIGDTPQD